MDTHNQTEISLPVTPTSQQTTPTPVVPDEMGPERILAFSDGVFAIAITLLVLGIHVPTPAELDHSNFGSLLNALRLQWPNYLSFLLSFLITGVIWGNHHTMFSYIKRSDHNLVILNLLLMLAVVIIPYPAGLLGLYLSQPQQSEAVMVYTAILAIGSIIYNALWWYASWNHRLLDAKLDRKGVRQVTWRYAFGPILYTIAFCLSFIWNGTPGLMMCGLLALGYLLPIVAGRVRS